MNVLDILLDETRARLARQLHAAHRHRERRTSRPIESSSASAPPASAWPPCIDSQTKLIGIVTGEDMIKRLVQSVVI